MAFTLAIVGRPNVGKSTLFNRLVGQRLALVDDRPGVTRDRREGAARLGPLRFTAIDTAGLEDAKGDGLTARMRRMTEAAVAEADVCLMVIDARAGVLPEDLVFAEILRKSSNHVILAANKAEARAAEAGVLEGYQLGLGEPVPVSAEHGIGMEALYAALAPLAEGFEAAGDAAGEADDEAETSVDVDDAEDWAPSDRRPLRIAVVGRPNAGKSTLINRILGEERLLTGPEAGITRDAISVASVWDGLPVRLFDTAGMRRKAKVHEKLEKLSVADGLRAVRFAEVVVVLMAADSPFDSQDLRLADLAEREGRAVVLAISKWDLEPDRQARRKRLVEDAERLLPQLRGTPVVTLSAQAGRGLGALQKAVTAAHRVWNTRVPTAALNRWLPAEVAAHPPPAPGGRRIRLRYMTQVKTRPPTFVAFCSAPDALPAAYRRFLVNGLRRDFDMAGTPIRLVLRKGKNPYAGRSR